MKRVAVLNDVHGNLPALEAVLAELDREPVDAIVCGGARFLAGNCEREVLHADDEVNAWMLARLGDRDRQLVRSWPAMSGW